MKYVSACVALYLKHPVEQQINFMKRNVNKLLRNVFLASAALSGIFMAGCNNSDYSKAGESSTTMPSDTMMVNHDTMMHSDNMGMNADTGSAMMVNPNRVDSATTVKMAKTPKKGKVSIVPATNVPANNTAMDMDKEGFYRNTEVLPAFPGGQKELERFFEKNIQYPEAATENDAQGTVNLVFAVDENGKIYQPMVTGNKLGYGIEEEAIRVFGKMPTWTPGKIKGKNVKTKYTLPIRFQLY